MNALVGVRHALQAGTAGPWASRSAGRLDANPGHAAGTR
jgi:hypothetical protein